MPMTFQQIATNTASVTISFGEGTITVVYYPNKVTDKMIAEIQAGLTNDNQLLEGLIKSWDIIDDTVDPPVMFPLDRMSEFGIFFKEKVAQEIMRDMRPEAVAPQT